MLIRVGFDIQFEVPSPVAMIALFHVHHTRSQTCENPMSRGSRRRCRSKNMKIRLEIFAPASWHRPESFSYTIRH